MSYSVGIVGATGAVGREMLNQLDRRAFPVKSLRLFATPRSQGLRLPFRGSDAEVWGIDVAPPTYSATGHKLVECFSGLDIVLFSAGSGVSRALAPVAVEAGATVVDNSSAFRMEPDVPLVVPEVNPDALNIHRGLISNPNCSTIQMVVVLKPIMDAAGLERVVVATYQSASGIGKKGADELEMAARASLESRSYAPRVFPRNIGFNLFPLIDSMEEGCHCREELKMVYETRKIMDAPDLPVSATTVRVPVYVGHSLALWIETKRKLSRDDCLDILRKAPGLNVFDEMRGEPTPTPVDVEQDDRVWVSRVREDPSNDRGLLLWAVANNIRKGAATNAVQIAEELACRGLLS